LKAYTSGNWNDPSLWVNSPSAATFPNNGNLGNTYDVVINGPYSGATLNVPATVHNLTLSDGGIGTTATFPAPGTNTLTVTGNFRWSGGTFHAPITVAPGGSLTIDTSAGTTLTYGGTLALGGAGSFAGTNAAAMKFDRVDTRFDIQPTGSLALDRVLTLSLPPVDPFSIPQTRPYMTMNNAGLFTLAAGSAVKITSTPIMLMNTGTVRATGASELGFSYTESSGLIDLQGASAALTFRSAPAPDSVVLSGGGVRLAAGSTLTFAQGEVQFAGPSVTNAGTINIQNGMHVTAPTTVPGAVNVTGSFTTTLDAPLTLTGRAVFSGSGYGFRLAGTARLTAYDLKPLGLTVGGAELYTPAGGTLDMGSNAAIGIDTGRVTVDGTMAWAPSSGGVYGVGTTAARVDVGAGGLIDIRPSATANFNRSVNTSNPSPDLLTNAGLIRTDHSTLTLNGTWNLNNTGTLRLGTASSATIKSPAATNAGTIELGDGAAFLFSGTAPYLGVPQFVNATAGVIRVPSNATATFDTGLLGSFNGVLTNAGLIEVSGGRLVSTNYGMTNSGTVRLTSAGNVQFKSVLVNTGQIDLATGTTMSVQLGSQNLTFNNRAGGAIAVGPSALLSLSVGYANVATNAGTIQIDRGQFTVDVGGAFSNTGTIAVTSGAMKLTYGPSFTNTGNIDLRDGGGLVLAGASSSDPTARLKTARDMILTGYHAGAWDGPGVDSASAAADPTTAVGYGPVTATGTFLGVALKPGDVLVRHTKNGDATLDGAVNFADLLALAKNYNTTNANWYQGDFNYDGSVNFADLLTLAKNYNAAMPAADALPGAPAAFSADLAAAFAQVPEPAAGLLAVTACGFALATRRRRVR
jgi:hypothetical protein